jgi:predicted ATPase
MISTFALRDFKGHRNTELELGRFTMLVGDNASGKTSVLDALALQARIVEDPGAVLRDVPLDDLVRRGAGGVAQLRTDGVRDRDRAWDTKLELRIGAGAVTRSGAYEREIMLSVGPANAYAFQGKALGIDVSSRWGAVSAPIRDLIANVAIYRLRAESIAAAAYSDQPDVRIEIDGANTAVALATMKLADDETFQRVENGLRTLIPSIERIRIRRAKVRHPSGQGEVVGSKLFFDFRGAADVPADGASYGTLIVLALLAILHKANRPNLILLDDFDHALHPRAQQELVRMIRSLLALDEFNSVQAVATTHSPYVLDELDASDVHAFALRDDGTVACKRLSQHPDAERTKGTLKAGQLWSLDPERDWVLRG